MNRSGHRTIRRGTHYNPWEHADNLGIQLLHRPLATANALWLPDHYTIVLRSGMGYNKERNILAHGIGHAVFRHKDDRPRHEDEADQFAAVNMVCPTELEYALRHHRDPVAELRVTARLLEAYLELAVR